MHSLIGYSIVSNSELKVGNYIKIKNTGFFNSATKAINAFDDKKVDPSTLFVVELKIKESDIFNFINSSLTNKKQSLLCKIISFKKI